MRVLILISAKSDNMSFSRIFLFSCLSLIIGIFFGLVVQNIQLLFLGTLLLISFISCLAFRRLRWLIIFCLIFFIFGFLRADFAKIRIVSNELQNFNGQEIVLAGLIVKEPEMTQKNQKLIIKVEKITQGESLDGSFYGGQSSANGRVLVYAPPYPQYQYGGRLSVIGKLEEPPILDDFDYKQYLARKNIYSIMFSPEIEQIKAQNKPKASVWIYKMILKWKSEMRLGLEQNFPSSQKSLLGAMLLGDKAGLTDELKNTLNKAGIRHLTAISGLHITIIVNLLMLLFLGLGLGRIQAFFLTIIFILFFVIMTGFQASTIRAGIMGFLLLLGQHFGRLGDSVRAIVLGAALMLAFNPFLFSDAGFQLSFLAVMGINYLFPIFSRWFLFRAPWLSSTGQPRSPP